ncbi:MAG TPA: lysylphosphatidylglycerol synthase transmembrane domain-containing protein [Candidatus Nanoarchaeia archaeon]|nr:lysylphosphatidylglycerol synthase transmembrane domain-containing protein [Candidatus Nanoarchaeia archaeon]
MVFSRRQMLSFGIALFLSVVFMWLLLREIPNREIWSALAHMSPVLAIAAFGIYGLIYLSRAVRFNSLLPKPLPLSKMFTIVCLHTLITTTIPARMGEFSYPYLLRKQKVEYAESLSTLIASRLFDLVAVGIWFAVMLPFLRPIPQLTMNMLYTLLSMATAGFLVLGMLIFWKLQLKVMVDAIRTWMGLQNTRWLTKLQRLVGMVLDTVKRYARRKVLIRLMLHSLVQWFLMFFFSFLVLRALGMQVTLPQSFVGSSLAMVVFLVPVQGMLGFGTTEAVWVLMFTALGFAKEQLIPLSFASHIFSVICIAIMGTWGLLHMRTLANSAPTGRAKPHSD